MRTPWLLPGPRNTSADEDSFPVRALAFTPDGTILASAGTEAQILLWDVEAGKIEEVTITGQKVSGIYRADKETFHTYAPVLYEGLADKLDAQGILIRR